MTTPRWLLPTVSVAAALALAVTGAIVGAGFAPQVTADVPSGTETVAVIAPVSTGSAPEYREPTSDNAPLPVSEAIAEREVLRPGADSGEIDPSLRDVLDALATAPDPLFELMVLDGDADGDGSPASADPCAPRPAEAGTGDAPADCPEGLRSTVLTLTHLRDFNAGGQAFPPTQEEFRAHGNPTGGSLWCDGPAPEAGQVPFGILSTAPGTFSIRYWPTERPGEVTTRGGIMTSDADRENFLSLVETADDASELPLLQSCLMLDGLEADTAYTAIVAGMDIFDRVSTPHTLRFHTTGAPVHPGAQIVTVGANLVLVSALHPVDQVVTVRAVVAEPDAIPSCTDLPPLGAGSQLSDVDVSVDPDAVNAQNAPPNFNHKRVVALAIPEGSTAIVCVRWFQGGDSTSWEREQPLFESSAVLQAPDRVLPSLDLTRISPYARGIDTVRVAVSSAEGNSCGSYRWDADTTETLPARVCEGEWGLRLGGAEEGDGRLRDVGASGDLVVRMTTTFLSGESTETSVLIPSLDDGCRGLCTLPEDAWYEVALGTVNQPTGLCGSSFGEDCTPPSRAVSAGTAQVRVSWSQGESNGRSDWNVTSTVDSAPGYVQPDAPQFDLYEAWTFSEPSFPPGYGSIAPLTYVSGRYNLVVDRPVDYTVRFTTGAPGATAERCDGGGPLEVSGHAEREALVLMPGACLGANYYGELELVDADGNRAFWNLNDRPNFWASGFVWVPTLTTSIRYAINAQTTGFAAIRRLSLALDGNDSGAVDTRSGRCTRDGLVESRGSFTAQLHWEVVLRFEIRLPNSGSWTAEDCSRNLSDDETQVVTVSIPLADLFRAEGVTITVPEAYNSRIVLYATRP